MESRVISYQTDHYKEVVDYKEATSTGDFVYFGSRYDLNKFYSDIDLNLESSKYLGCVLYPERKSREDNIWTYEKNMAFWAGIIDRKRSLKLFTPIQNYPNKQNEVSGTISEILWLTDNGYTLKPCTSNRRITLFYPPSVQPIEKTIVDYSIINKDEVLQRFNKIKASYLGNNCISNFESGKNYSKNQTFFRQEEKKEENRLKRRSSFDGNTDKNKITKFESDDVTKQNRINRFKK